MPVQAVSNTDAMDVQYDNVLFTQDGPIGQAWRTVRSQIGRGDKAAVFKATGAGGKSTAAAVLRLLAGIKEAQFEVKAQASIKNLDEALKLKEEGNDFYRNKKYGDAYNCYTQALVYCPVQEEPDPACPANKQYSIILANRSAALDGAGLYAACIRDIDMALKFGYPREFWYKIYKRKGHAAIKMKQYLLAKEALETALKNVGRSDIKKEKDRDNYRMKIRKQMTVFNVTKSLYNVDMYERLPSTLADGQPEDRGMSSKMALKTTEDGNSLVAVQPIEPEDVLVAVDPYVAVVNVSGGRAGGKICPHRIEKMFQPIPCRLGSNQLFGSVEAREEASSNYHQYEWCILSALTGSGLLERARLALRMVTSLPPGQVATLLRHLDSNTPTAEDAVEPELRTAFHTYKLPLENVSEEEGVVCAVVALYLTQALRVAGYMASVPTLEEVQVFDLLCRALHIALRHTRKIELLDVPKQKLSLVEVGTEVVRDTCAFGIYPQLHSIESAATGEKSHVISWFQNKKLILSSFRKIDTGSKIVLRSHPGPVEPTEQKPNDMITFRCANELCANYFPLKENTKEKIISCPIDECGIKTNIWERLKLIQRLKKDFASAKEEFRRDEIPLARDILKDTIDEWDRIIIRPYREVTQLEKLYVKTLLCHVGDSERLLVEGNQMGHIVNLKKPVNVMEEKKEEEKTAIIKI